MEENTEESQEEIRKQQRNFYLHLSPIEGHDIAAEHGGFTPPSEDAMEAEIRDVLSLWMTLQQGKGGTLLANSAWWMTRYMDPDNKMDASEGVSMLDNLTAFSIAVLAGLIEAKVVEVIDKPDLPSILLSTEGLMDDDEIDLFSKFEELFTKPSEEEDD